MQYKRLIGFNDNLFRKDVNMNKSRVMICLVCAGISFGFLLSGCKKSGQPGSEPNNTGAVAKQKIGQAVEATGQYLAEQKDTFIEQAKKSYSSLESNTDKLMSQMQNETSEDWQKTKAELNEKMQVAKQKLNDLQNQSGEGWEQAKKAFDDALDELKNAYEKAKTKVQSQ
jgi:ElaB/YqjD/DUF883 family membrane-anchored ribosome-binding protein